MPSNSFLAVLFASCPHQKSLIPGGLVLFLIIVNIEVIDPDKSTHNRKVPPMKKHLIILNPSAAKGAALKKKDEIEKLLQQFEIDYTLIVSEKPGHPVALAEQACEKAYDVVVAVGGDGTANEVINGLMDAKQAGKEIPTMGVIPAGRGNDFAASMGVSGHIAQAVKALADGKSRMIDVGQLMGGDYPQGK